MRCRIRHKCDNSLETSFHICYIVFGEVPLATVREIAREAEVSIATVSRVLNNTATVSPDVRDRVLDVAGRLRYGATRRSATNYIALAYTGPSSLGSPYDIAILAGMSEAAEAADLDLVVTQLKPPARGSGETPAQILARKGIRGAVLRTTTDTRHVCAALARDDFPSVVVGERFGDDEPRVSFLYADSRPTSQQAVEHLISVGHRRIAVVLNMVVDNDHEDRLHGYEQAHREHGLAVDPRLVLRVGAQRPNGAQVIRTVMSMRDRPTAVFIADPPIAVGAINQAHEMGVRIPDDLSILGFDDTDTRNEVYPTMSAICQDAHRLGFEAAKALARRLAAPPGTDGDTAPLRAAHPTWLELHGTVGQPPATAVRVLPDGSRINEDGDSAANLIQSR
jgi:DNA-binding LacI/PurR family transcriptional regulator